MYATFWGRTLTYDNIIPTFYRHVYKWDSCDQAKSVLGTKVGCNRAASVGLNAKYGENNN